MEGTFVAQRPFQYGPDPEADQLDFHQVFEMRHEKNDEVLARLRYVVPLAAKARTVSCGLCGRKFTEDFALARHGQQRHSPRHLPTIKDDDLGPIDLNDPGALIARARRLEAEMKTTMPVDGMMVPSPDAELDRESAAEEKFLNDASPLDLTKTKAALKANDVKVPDISTRRAARKPSKTAAKRRK